MAINMATYYQKFKNDDGTTTAFYSGDQTVKGCSYNVMATTGAVVYKDKDYSVKVLSVREKAIITRYEYTDGQVWDHSFTPRAFYETFFKGGY